MSVSISIVQDAGVRGACNMPELFYVISPKIGCLQTANFFSNLNPPARLVPKSPEKKAHCLFTFGSIELMKTQGNDTMFINFELVDLLFITLLSLA